MRRFTLHYLNIIEALKY